MAYESESLPRTSLFLPLLLRYFASSYQPRLLTPPPPDFIIPRPLSSFHSLLTSRVGLARRFWRF
jgi:hypothetical protein